MFQPKRTKYRKQQKGRNTGNAVSHTFNLADCPFKKVKENVSENNFEFELPVSKIKFPLSFINQYFSDRYFFKILKILKSIKNFESLEKSQNIEKY